MSEELDNWLEQGKQILQDPDQVFQPVVLLGLLVGIAEELRTKKVPTRK